MAIDVKNPEPQAEPKVLLDPKGQPLRSTEDYEALPLHSASPGTQPIDAVVWLERWTGLTCAASDTEIAKAKSEEGYFEVTEFGTINDGHDDKGKRVAGLQVVLNWQMFQKRDGRLLVGGEPLLARTLVAERYYRDLAAKRVKAASKLSAGSSNSATADPRGDFTRVVRENPGAFEAGQDARPMEYKGTRQISEAQPQ